MDYSTTNLCNHVTHVRCGFFRFTSSKNSIHFQKILRSIPNFENLDQQTLNHVKIICFKLLCGSNNKTAQRTGGQKGWAVMLPLPLLPTAPPRETKQT